MVNAVIFASWMPKLNRAAYYIKELKTYFSDYDIYVGINPSPHSKKWNNLLLNSGLNIKTIFANKRLHNGSDASAFQAALKLYKESNIDYDYIHFIHTKGISYNSRKWSVAHRDYFIPACKCAHNAEKFLDENTLYGGWGRIGSTVAKQHHHNFLNLYFSTKRYYHQRTVWFMTFYTIRGKLVKNFVETCEPSFFMQKLYKYFFECNFPLIVDEQGHVRYIFEWWKYKSTNEAVLKEWLDENGKLAQ